MVNTVQHKRGTTAQVNSYTGAVGEFIYNTTTKRIHAQDGATAGGIPHALVSDVDLKANASVAISAGSGLTGGGTLAANRTLALSSASIASLALADSAVQSVNGKTGSSITLTKADVGLSNVDNTSDASKPVSTATQTALNAKANSSVTVSAGTGLTGGGNLTANRSVALNSASIASLGKADTALQAPGGTTGQILAKSSNTTNDVAWVTSEAATAVSYASQTLTDAQKSQARANIDADKVYNSVSDVQSSVINSSVTAIRANGYSSAGDGGAALYKRVSGEPAHPGKVQSADGAWWELSEHEIYVEMFGAIGGEILNKSTLPNSSQSFRDAVLYASIKGGVTIYASKNCYRFTSNLVIGNGTSTTISTYNNIKIIGGSGQVTTGEFAPLTGGTYIFYDGATLVNTGVFRIDGPAYGIEVSGFLIDANEKSPFGIDAIHIYRSSIKNVAAIGWTWRGFNFRTWDAPLYPGITQGFMSNEFVGLSSRQPAPGAQAGIYMSGNEEFNIGFSRNKFSLCDFAIPNLPTGVGMYWGMIDNNSFDRCFCFYTSGEHYGDGVGIFMEQGGPTGFETTFPSENIVINSPIYGGVAGQSGTGGNIFIGYPTADGAPIPNDPNIYVLTFDGVLRGGFSGSVQNLLGKVDPDSGLGTTIADQFLNVIGSSTPSSSFYPRAYFLGEDTIVSEFSCFIGVAPGSGNQRKFTLSVNNIDTSASVTFGSTESLQKSYSGPPITIPAGSLVSIKSSVIGGSVAQSDFYSYIGFRVH